MYVTQLLHFTSVAIYLSQIFGVKEQKCITDYTIENDALESHPFTMVENLFEIDWTLSKNRDPNMAENENEATSGRKRFAADRK